MSHTVRDHIADRKRPRTRRYVANHDHPLNTGFSVFPLVINNLQTRS